MNGEISFHVILPLDPLDVSLVDFADILDFVNHTAMERW
jgi:hypothetical protein